MGLLRVMAGYAADMVDGSVARALREANRFGAEFDTAADFVTQAVAPALIVYLATATPPPRSGCRRAPRSCSAPRSPPR